MTKDERDRIEKELSQVYDDASTNGVKVDNTFNLLATMQDLGNDLEALEIHNYEADLEDAVQEGVQTVDAMADLYLNSNAELMNNAYIKKKRQHDASNQADILFLQKITKKAIVMQLKAMDLGDNSPRHFETFYNGIKELRENIKHASLTQNQMEGFYKSIRTDLGISTEPIGKEIEELANQPKNNIVDTKNLNSQLDAYMEQMKKEMDEAQKKNGGK